MNIGRVIGIVVLLIVGGATAAAVFMHTNAPPAASVPAPRSTPEAPSANVPWLHNPASGDCASNCHYVGVALASSVSLPSFALQTGVNPDLVVIYKRFGAPFPTTWVSAMIANGRMPLIQINPYGVSLAAIASGRYDSYLTAYGAALKKLNHAVGVSFGHEANGYWYPWGCRTPASEYVAAWRRIHDVIRGAGAHKAIWVWTMNTRFRETCSLSQRYPGNAYVSWVGLDGYLRSTTSTFDGLFGATLQEVRNITNKPILIAETGVPALPNQGQEILALYRGAATTPGVIGVVYFDSSTPKGDYRPQDSPAALAAFRKATAAYQSGKG